MKSEKDSDYYDEVFRLNRGFSVHYRQSFYFVHWTQVIVFLRKIPNPKILEIGCGTGQLAEYLNDEGFDDYHGFDFSEKAIEVANERVDRPFYVANAKCPAAYKIGYNTVICLEVLEHIWEDISVLRNIREGTNIIFSVPNFDAESHVRWFNNERQIKSRYLKYVDLQDIVRIGNIFICSGVVSGFDPSLLQLLLKSREKVNFKSFYIRIAHKIKNLFKIKS